MRPRLVPILLLALAGCAAPSVPASAQDVDTAGLLHDLEVLAADSMSGRAAGTDGGRMARDYLVTRLRAMGFEPAQDTFAVMRRDGEVEGVNVRVALDGTVHPDRTIVVTAHYDHLGVREGEIYNGADDNASGTAGLLALAADFASRPPDHSILLVFTDAEEGGLQGARHFVSAPPVPLDAVILNVNLDMVAHSDAELWVTGTFPWPALRPVVEAVEPVPPVTLLFGHDTPDDEGADNWIMASDHGPFHAEGIPFLYFGVADHPDYHRPSDDVDTIDPAFFRAAVETVGRVLRAADGALAGERPAG